MGRPRSWSDDDLRRAVEVSTSWSDVARALDLFLNAKNIGRVRQRAWALHIDTSHFRPGGKPKPAVPVVVEGTVAERRTAQRFLPRKWTDEGLVAAVAAATSWAGVHRELGITIGGSTYGLLQQRSRDLGLDTSHFRGQGWLKGKPHPLPKPKRALEDVLVSHSVYPTHELKRRLLLDGLREARCERCGGFEWQGQPMPLELDHINGVRTDNRIENLRILCPNCHAQTDTYCGKNIRR